MAFWEINFLADTKGGNWLVCSHPRPFLPLTAAPSGLGRFSQHRDKGASLISRDAKLFCPEPSFAQRLCPQVRFKVKKRERVTSLGESGESFGVSTQHEMNDLKLYARALYCALNHNII
jgi:hypothetical protein